MAEIADREVGEFWKRRRFLQPEESEEGPLSISCVEAGAGHDLDRLRLLHDYHQAALRGAGLH